MEGAMVRDHNSRCFRSYRETGARAHHAGIEAIVVGHDVVKDLVVIVHSNDLPRLRMDDVRHENVVLQDGIRNRAAAAAKPWSSEEFGTKNVIPLLTDIQRVCGYGNTARRGCGATGSLKVAGGAAAGPRGRRGIAAVRMVGHVFPIAVPDYSIINAEPLLLALYEYGRRIRVRSKTAVRIQERLSLRVLDYPIGFHNDDGAVGEPVHRVWRDAGRDGVGPDDPDLAILIIVEGVNLNERHLIVGREADSIDDRGGQRRQRLRPCPE